ncbi:nicotinate-nucleotide adenylyltransferase [hydrocarbon metagenome]|uniref:Nicotinate-nucleotide adenylyltransferase n=1 Tax=hydrocarbon metagenome TaxID=938273 RepID=A0A0W8E797_9ZZZZ
MSVTSLGILGGTFNPVHFGHLIAAECARVEFGLDRVIFVPARIPPHKDARGILAEEKRYQMVEIAVRNNPAFEVSDLELKREGVSYTIDTIEYYRETYPGCRIFFIMGLDSLFILDTWKDIERLAEMCRFIIVTRPGYNINDEGKLRDRLPPVFWRQADFIPIPGLDISSSDIRKRVSNGKPIRYMLPANVERYIRENYLYQEG